MLDSTMFSSGPTDRILRSGGSVVVGSAGQVTITPKAGQATTIAAGNIVVTNGTGTITVTDAVTNTYTDVLTVSHDSSGTPAASFATSILFNGASSTTADQNMARIQAYWTTATHASRASALAFQTLTAAGSLTTQLWIAGNGQIGIGAAPTSGGSLLQQTGNVSNVMASFMHSANGTGVSISGGTGSTQANVFSDYQGTATEPTLHLATYTNRSSTTAGLFIDTAGRVGIGLIGNGSQLRVDQVNTGTGNDQGTIWVTSSDANSNADNGGYITFGGKYDGTLYAGWAGIAGRKENSTSGNYSGYLVFSTRTSGSVQSEKWRITSGGHLITGTDNTYDIGASGATRPRDIWVANRVQVGTVGGSTPVVLLGNANFQSFSIQGTINSTGNSQNAIINTAITSTATSSYIYPLYLNASLTVNGSTTLTRYAQLICAGVSATVTGTLTNHNSLYITNPTNGTTVRPIDTDSGAYLTTGGSWTNNPSWDRYKTAKRYLDRATVGGWLDQIAEGEDASRPAFYRHDGRPLDAGRVDTPRPVHQAYEHDTLFPILDDLPEDVRYAITVDPHGGIGTKDMDGFLYALVQEQALRMTELKAEITALRA